MGFQVLNQVGVNWERKVQQSVVVRDLQPVGHHAEELSSGLIDVLKFASYEEGSGTKAVQVLEIDLLSEDQVVNNCDTYVESLLLKPFDLVVNFGDPVNQISSIEFVHLHERYLPLRVNHILLIETLDLLVPHPSNFHKLPILIFLFKGVFKYFLLVLFQFEKWRCRLVK